MESSDEAIGTELKEGAGNTFKKGRTFRIPGVNGSVVHTIQIYFTAKRATENLIKSTIRHQPAAAFHNCADGAEIEGALWTSRDEFIKNAQASANKTERLRVINKIFDSEAKTVSVSEMEKQLAHTQEKLSALAQKLESRLITRRLRGKKTLPGCVRK